MIFDFWDTQHSSIHSRMTTIAENFVPKNVCQSKMNRFNLRPERKIVGRNKKSFSWFFFSKKWIMANEKMKKTYPLIFFYIEKRMIEFTYSKCFELNIECSMSRKRRCRKDKKRALVHFSCLLSTSRNNVHTIKLVLLGTLDKNIIWQKWAYLYFEWETNNKSI